MELTSIEIAATLPKKSQSGSAIEFEDAVRQWEHVYLSSHYTYIDTIDLLAETVKPYGPYSAASVASASSTT